MSERTVLVTGGAGYVGSHACKALAAAGYEPVVYDNLCRGRRSAVRWGPLIEGELEDRDRLSEAIRSHQIEAVMHFAALADVGESVRQPELYYRNNVVGTLSLLEAMRGTGIEMLVFSSTCAVYGIPDSVPIREWSTGLPLSPYGETKLAIERALRWYGTAHNWRYAALRYFNAAGADPECQIGENHDPETHLIPLAIRAALDGNPIEVFGTDYPTRDGTAIRDYIHVSDLAAAHVRALDCLRSGALLRAQNLGTGSGFSVREVLAAVEKVVGRPVPQREAPRRAGDPPELVADASLAEKHLNWSPVRSDLDTIVRTAFAWETSDHRR